MNSIIIALTRNAKIFAISLFFGITSLWGLCEPFFSVFSTDSNKYWFLLPFTIISLFIAFWRAWPKNKVNFKLPNTNTEIELKFGDLFETTGNIAIAFNEFFDTEIGKPVSSKSLQGYFIENIFGRKTQLLDDAIDKGLKDKHYANIQRQIGKNKKFKIGTTVPIEFGDKKYLIFALSRTNDNYEAYSDPSMILYALQGLFDTARIECNGYDLNLPLIGSGLSRSGLAAKYLIELILIGVLIATKKSKITDKINLIIHPSFFKEIDFNEIKRKWS